LTNLVNAGIINPSQDSLFSPEKGEINCRLNSKTTQTFITDIPEWDDPTYGATRGGGAEKLDMNYDDAGVMA
jgi:hypothetical protein